MSNQGKNKLRAFVRLLPAIVIILCFCVGVVAFVNQQIEHSKHMRQIQQEYETSEQKKEIDKLISQVEENSKKTSEMVSNFEALQSILDELGD